jgi:ubiquinone/menaquinone biosynthesis C-methylase UbiE
MSGYVLQGGEAGAGRLRLLARVKWPTTEPLLLRAGLRPGLHCLDAGCGIGLVTVELARRAGPDGSAVGIDINEHYLDLARQEATRQGVPAVFRAGRVADLDERARYDLAYARFLLSHLPEPALALERLVRSLRPGGVLVLEDIDFRGHFCYPPCGAFDRYVALYREVVRRRGGDADIGPRLFGLALDAGLAEVRVDLVQPTFHEGEGKLVAQMTLAQIGEALVAEGLAMMEEVAALVGELDAFVQNPRTIVSLPRIFQVWGVEPIEGRAL